jgi:hypothetical protein
MRRLVTIATLGLAISFSSVTFASDYMSLYTKPIVRSEVRNEIKGGNVESNLMSFYTTPKEWSVTASPITGEQKPDERYISVFGVQISLK